MIVRIHHVQITVPVDQEVAAKDFYCGVLGFREIPKPDSLRTRGGFWLQIGEQELHVSVENGVNRFVTKAHVAYQVNDLNLWRKKLSDAGCTILESLVIPGCARFETRDPFGNRLECIEPVAE